MTKALRQGALADTLSRFPVFAKIMMAVMPGQIEKLMRDTKIHEAHSIDLIKRFAHVLPSLGSPEAKVARQETEEPE